MFDTPMKSLKSINMFEHDTLIPLVPNCTYKLDRVHHPLNPKVLIGVHHSYETGINVPTYK